MTSTLLLRLAGPMQSWGQQSRFKQRDTAMEPSKSGVVGLLCAALGRGRDVPVDDLAALRLGVRVDREGVMAADFQTAGGSRRRDEFGGVPRASWDGRRRTENSHEVTVTSHRFYLADAAFLVGLEGADAVALRELAAALVAPVWPLYLGRRGHVPALPVVFGTVEGDDGVREGGALEETLRECSWPLGLPAELTPPWRRPAEVRAVVEAGLEGAAVRLDQPVGAAFLTRRFAVRRVRSEIWALPTDECSSDQAKEQ